jgi:hypothetical protein
VPRLLLLIGLFIVIHHVHGGCDTFDAISCRLSVDDIPFEGRGDTTYAPSVDSDNPIYPSLTARSAFANRSSTSFQPAWYGLTLAENTTAATTNRCMNVIAAASFNPVMALYTGILDNFVSNGATNNVQCIEPISRSTRQAIDGDLTQYYGALAFQVQSSVYYDLILTADYEKAGAYGLRIIVDMGDCVPTYLLTDENIATLVIPAFDPEYSSSSSSSTSATSGDGASTSSDSGGSNGGGDTSESAPSRALAHSYCTIGWCVWMLFWSCCYCYTSR